MPIMITFEPQAGSTVQPFREASPNVPSWMIADERHTAVAMQHARTIALALKRRPFTVPLYVFPFSCKVWRIVSWRQKSLFCNDGPRKRGERWWRIQAMHGTIWSATNHMFLASLHERYQTCNSVTKLRSVLLRQAGPGKWFTCSHTCAHALTPVPSNTFTCTRCPPPLLPHRYRSPTA